MLVRTTGAKALFDLGALRGAKAPLSTALHAFVRFSGAAFAARLVFCPWLS